MDYLIANASIVNEGEVFTGDVLLADGTISAVIRPDDSRQDVRDRMGRAGVCTIDAKGKYLIPGIIDEHVHFREPGFTYKADIHSESRAAVAGGVTSFMDMPNTSPQTVTRQLLEEKKALASQKSLANYSFYLGATNDNLREILEMDVSDVCGVKLFMGSSTGNMLVDSPDTLDALFRESPCLIAAHCEDETTIRRNMEMYRSLNDGGKTAGASIHPLIRSNEACLSSARRAILLALKTGARFHLLHVSTEAELELLCSDIALEQKTITAETCPHYLLLDDRRYADLGLAIKCNPAIKSGSDRSALVKAVRNGLIDTIGTDHAPHLKEEKFTGDYFTSKSGFPSIQHSLELMCTVPGLDVTDVVRLMCHNPATLYGVDRRGFIREGYHADLVIVDPEYSGCINGASELCKCGWTPYEGFRTGVTVTHTFVNGNLVYENGIFHEDSRGQGLKFRRNRC